MMLIKPEVDSRQNYFPFHAAYVLLSLK